MVSAEAGVSNDHGFKGDAGCSFVCPGTSWFCSCVGVADGHFCEGGGLRVALCVGVHCGGVLPIVFFWTERKQYVSQQVRRKHDAQSGA